jgi:ATP-dependent Clp protease ATP-binding subunit ClpA
MMFERFTDEARAVVALASEHARRLGHRYIGGEHLLLAAVTAGQPASEVLCAHGVTPELVEEEIVRRVGLGAGAGLFGSLDKDALATIGIDLDAVRARIESSFGPQALARAAQAAHRDPRRRPGPRPPRLVRQWRRRRRARRAMTTVPAPGPRPVEATGRYRAPGPPPSGHIPFTPAAKKILELTVRESDGMGDSYVGAEHVALALTRMKQGLVPPILAEARTTAEALRIAILDRYRRAS